MQTNNVIKLTSLVIAFYLHFLSYPADARTDTPHFAYERPEVPNNYYLMPEIYPREPGLSNGSDANTLSDTGRSDVPGAQYPDVRE
jgi:hypothetical protein